MSQPRSILEDPVSSPPIEVSDPARPADSACPRCGAPLRGDQEWCLNCGTAVTTRVAGASGWRTPMAILASLIAIALVGLVAAFLAVSNDPDEVAQAPPLTASQQAAPTAPPAAPTPEPDPITPETIPPATGGDQPPETDDDPTTAGGDTSAVSTWPAGKSAWTVVMLSSPSRAEADKKAKELQSGGTDVGVLKSDEFKSLRAGYFVVFSGEYDTEGAAEKALTSLRSNAPEAYVRRVTPR